MRYDDLEKLHDLHQRGILTAEEYQREKERLLSQAAAPARTTSGEFWGMDERTFAMVLHFSMLLCFLLPLVGLAAPIIMWAVFHERSAFIDAHGRSAINWIITSVIASLIALPLCLIGVGFLILLGVAAVTVVGSILAGIKAQEGRTWTYPCAYRFLKASTPSA